MKGPAYPRVAIVAANPLRRDMPNGILLSSLFDGWPSDRLAQVYFPAGVSYLPEFDVCRQFSMVCTSGRVRRFHAPTEGEQGRVNASANPVSTARASWQRKLLTYVKQRRHLLNVLRVGQEAWNAYSWMGRTLARELKFLRPDIVFADLGNFCMTRMTCRACEQLGLPLFLHVGDDFVRALYRDMPAAPILQQLSEYWFRRAVRCADGLETVSPVAVDEFQRRYGGQWDWFTTLVNPNHHDPSPRPPDGTIRLVYAGNLGIERWRSLRQLALALQSLRERRGVSAQLDIYSSRDQLAVHRNALAIPGTTALHDWVAREALPKVLQQADILVHVESFDPAIAEYARFSFSTKLSDYMMAGRCILSFGPTDLASMRMVRLAQAGITVDHRDSANLEESLWTLCQDASRRGEYGRAGRSWAMTWLDERPRRQAFRQAIVAAVLRARRRLRPGSEGARPAAA